ncbi:MAG: hypothetical protein ACSNEK_07945 [Parachlamydiaceae bacterium]
MRPVLLYSHTDEPITRALFSSELDQKFNMIKLSLELLLRDTIIIDEFNENEVKVDWTLPSGSKISNSKEFYLINRVVSIPEALFHDFVEEDKIYSLSEFRSYLAFAIEAFPLCFSKPGAFGLSGNRYSLPRQWERVQQSSLLVKVPRYYLGDMRYCELRGEIVYSEPFNFYYWKPNTKVKYEPSFAFERPPGKPIIVCVIGDEIEIFPYYSYESLSIEDIQLIKEISKEVAKLFDYPISESLFFIDNNKVSFGMITNIPYASRNKKCFSSMVSSFLIEIMERDGKS